MLTGQCLCGGVAFTVDAAVEGASACHCGQCRKQSGHFWASAQAPEEAIAINGTLRWYAATPQAKRGFCPTCGSFLFWKAHDEDTMSFALGALDAPTGLRLEKHIFTADKGDYYEIGNDGVPRE
ncbi:aldehyde-activating protein [Maritimibacter sp. 55A14]|uniref:GFA family protein n=1 Tax=Maritimibacter sp. 55A14 TaxID=2174844 RepID=UPI000D61B8C8|nr:GFA family protein [Maritimibacter sp. 55A14]PWE29323.1 aldehyde-activating protein [Maritimibacter sp. 55A14]